MKRLLRMATVACLAISPFAAETFAAEAPNGPGGLCGGIAGFRCRPGLYCETDADAHCGGGDMTGTCRKRPTVCTRIFKPVCGCDRKTYGNDCERQTAGVGKLNDGACE